MTISELRKKSNDFVRNLDVEIALVVEHNQDLIKLNQEQMKASTDSEGRPLVNRMTGRKTLSPAYQKKTGKTYPDLFLTGDFQRDMDILVNEGQGSYFLTSFDEKKDKLEDWYSEKIFGIKDKEQAQRIIVPLLKQRYERKVLQ
jgi:hypothetical protein